MNSNHLKLDNQICHRLYLASNGLTRLYRPLLAPLNLTYPQYIVMMVLWEKDALTPLEVSEIASIDKGSLTSILRKLNEKGFIKLRDDKEDKRKKSIYITNKGHKLREKAISIPKELLCLFELDKEDLIKLKDILDKFNSQIKI